ncbi:SDR family oxidoreductase [Rhodocytophaga rosea]|uniref:SDR family oxidoreductase n=1 Tax=Rhodocytophaga rosea TaxID=2704465 RepID=A0A6C0GMB9_9BACT|nr:SDR family oxidoreductase [Rhodocytophaga rosea]QHT68773.1 SDR family oxidoreductase [Rhodocytophaga rosea]
MNIIVFGASGATGQQIVSQGLSAGHSVTAFVRNPEKITLQHQLLRVVQGNVKNYKEVESAIQKQQAVISTLGVSKTFRHDPDVIQGVQHIVKAMEKHQVKRLVYQSTFGVPECRVDFGFFAQNVLPVLLHKEFQDHTHKENLIRKSHLDFVIVRPVMLTNGPRTGKYRHGEKIVFSSLISTISRADVAEFMLRQLSDPTYLYKAPRVMQ